MLYPILVVVQVFVAILLIVFVLLQHGKGADAGAAFGSGSSGTVFGARGSANFLSRTTAVLAALFYAVSLSMAYLVHGQGPAKSVIERQAQQQQQQPKSAQLPEVTPPAGPAQPQTPAPKVPPEEPGK